MEDRNLDKATRHFQIVEFHGETGLNLHKIHHELPGDWRVIDCKKLTHLVKLTLRGGHATHHQIYGCRICSSKGTKKIVKAERFTNTNVWKNIIWKQPMIQGSSGRLKV